MKRSLPISLTFTVSYNTLCYMQMDRQMITKRPLYWWCEAPLYKYQWKRTECIKKCYEKEKAKQMIFLSLCLHYLQSRFEKLWALIFNIHTQYFCNIWCLDNWTTDGDSWNFPIHMNGKLTHNLDRKAYFILCYKYWVMALCLEPSGFQRNLLFPRQRSWALHHHNNIRIL